MALAAPAEARAAEGEHALLFHAINFTILVAGLAFILRKPLAQFFADRTAAIRKSLDEGRQALETSQAELKRVQDKLAHLEEEIAAFRAASLEEMKAEREEMRRATAEEGARMLASARAQMETAAKAAQLELRLFAARQALALAEESIRQRLDEPARRRLVSQFLARLGARQSSN
jgi:F-type H+-transporting ATPase subunit b